MNFNYLKCILFGHNISVSYSILADFIDNKHFTVYKEYKGGYCNKCNRYIKKIRCIDIKEL